jgi:hypothetical protein
MTSATMHPIERYGALAEAFRRCHRFAAPGKDMPLECYEERPDDAHERWSAFLSMLGPIDRAAVLSRWLQENE